MFESQHHLSKSSEEARMQLTTVYEFHRYRTNESKEAEQNDQTRPEVHASVWDSAIFKTRENTKTGQK